MDGAGTTVVTVSFNTLDLTALLLWSLHTVLEADIEILVVDNASTDGSAELLRAAADADLCELLANSRNLHHGPALNQALTHLSCRPDRRWAWVVDSDVVIARADSFDRSVGLAESASASIVGERRWDPWKSVERFELYSLLIDLPVVWHPGGARFNDDGDPSFDLLEADRRAGHKHVDFPFTADGYLIHRGRGTLAAVAASGDVANPLYQWAIDHHEPHFGGVPGAKESYDDLVQEFRANVPDLTAPALITACGR